MRGRVLPHEVTDEEVSAGFALRSIGTSGIGNIILAVTADLARGLRAVKVRREDGEIEYGIWDQASNVPIYFPARTVGELADRFPP